MAWRDSVQETLTPEVWRQARPPLGIWFIVATIVAVSLAALGIIAFFFIGIMLNLQGAPAWFFAFVFAGFLVTYAVVVPIILAFLLGAFALASGRPWGLHAGRAVLVCFTFASLVFLERGYGLVPFLSAAVVSLLLSVYLFLPRVTAYYRRGPVGQPAEVRLLGRDVPAGMVLIVTLLVIMGAQYIIGFFAASVFLGAFGISYLSLVLTDPAQFLTLMAPVPMLLLGLGLIRGHRWAWYGTLLVVPFVALSGGLWPGEDQTPYVATLAGLSVAALLVWYIHEPQVQLHCGVAHRAFWQRF